MLLAVDCHHDERGARAKDQSRIKPIAVLTAITILCARDRVTPESVSCTTSTNLITPSKPEKPVSTATQRPRKCSPRSWTPSSDLLFDNPPARAIQRLSRSVRRNLSAGVTAVGQEEGHAEHEHNGYPIDGDDVVSQRGPDGTRNTTGWSHRLIRSGRTAARSVAIRAEWNRRNPP